MPITRLTTASYLVLGLVRHLGTASPYDVKQAVAGTIGPFWALPHAQVYVQCDKLVEAGLLAQSQEKSGRQRRTLSLTDEGHDALTEWLHDDTFVPVEARDLGLLKLFFGGSPEVIAPTQIHEHRRSLKGYEHLAAVGGEHLPQGPHGALTFGLQYERWMIQFWTDQLQKQSS